MVDTKPPEQKQEEKEPLSQIPDAGEIDEEEGDDFDEFALLDEAGEELDKPKAGDPPAGDGDPQAGDPPAERRDAPAERVEPPKVVEVFRPQVPLAPEEERCVQLQNILIAKANTGLISVAGKDSEQMRQLLERVRMEQSGQENKTKPGHPEFGPATQELFAAYKQYLEQKGVKDLMQQLADMSLGTPTRSLEQLRVVNQYGQLVPEQPIDFVNRMRRGETDYRLKALDQGTNAMVEVATDKIPTQDALDRMLGAEAFIKWGQDQIVFDRKVRLQERRLEERIQEEGWPKEWLEHPAKQTDRAGWCMAVMQRMEEARRVGRTVEAIYHLRNKDGMEKFGQEALDSLPPHVKVELEMDGDEVKSVKRVSLDHPLDLDLQNPDFTVKREAEQKWLAEHAPEVFELMQKKEMAGKDPRYFLYQGDIETRGMSALIDKKTGEVVTAFRTADFDTEEKRKELYGGRPASDFEIADFNVIRCRMEAGKETGVGTEVKNITVDYGMQYAHANILDRYNMFVSDVGKPAHPPADEHTDGKLRFRPDEWVVTRGHHGEEVPMQAKDLADHIAFEDFKRNAELAVTVVMDASMFIGGAGLLIKGAQVAKGAHAAYSALQASQKGMALIRAGNLTVGSLERAGLKMMMKGGTEAFIGISGVYKNDDFQHVRGMYFLGKAAIDLPGISRGTHAVQRWMGAGKDAERIKQVHDVLGIKDGRVLSALMGTSEQGFKWTNRAFALIMSKELYDQHHFIQNIGTPDGLSIAQDRMRGIKPPETPPTAEQQWQKQEQFLKTAEKSLEDYLKTQDITNKEEVQKILDRTRQLLEPPPRELLGPPPREADLKAHYERRKQEIADYQRDLRKTYLQFDAARIRQAEIQRAEKTTVWSQSQYDKLKEDPLIVSSTVLEKGRLDEAEKALAAKQEEIKALGEPTTDAERHEREEAILKAQLQRDYAQQKHEEAVRTAATQLRLLETKDEAIGGEHKFKGKEDVQKAAALAYLILETSREGEMPRDGVLHSEDITIPGWSVEKTWTEAAGEHTVERRASVTVPDRTITQQLTVRDLASFLTPDLTGDNPNTRRIATAEVLDRLSVITPEMHASTLKRILLDPAADAADKNRAIANLGAVITQLELDEARREHGLPVDLKFVQSGERFTNNAADLRKVLDEVARDQAQNADVRAFASYQTYLLNRKGGYFDDADKAFFQKAIDKDPPGLSYAEYAQYMKSLAGLPHDGKHPPALDVNDRAGWDRRLRAALALEQLVDPATGRSKDNDFTYKDVNQAIAGCIDARRPEQALHVVETMLAPVKHDGVERSRLHQLDRENPALAMQVRERALEALKTPNPALSPDQLALRTKLIESMPRLLTNEGADASQHARLAELRREAARVITASLYATSPEEIVGLRASIKEAESKGQNSDALKQQLRVAEREYSEITGRRVNPNGTEPFDLPGDPANPRPDLTTLNMAGYMDENLRKASVTALGALGAQDAETLRVLKERATSPASDSDANTRVEGSPEVRMAALRALERVMSPLDFSRMANELVKTERSPGVAARLRANTWYSDLGLDPQSLRYQDRVAELSEWNEITNPNADALARKYYEKQGDQTPPHYWLNAEDLHQRIVKAIDGQYHWLSQLFTNGRTVQNDELKAIRAELTAYKERAEGLIAKAYTTGTDAASAQARREAQEICFAMLLDPPEGFQTHQRYKDEHLKAGYGNAYYDFNDKMLKGLQVDAAQALVKACEPGMPDRVAAGKMVLVAMEKTSDPKIRWELMKGLQALAKDKFGADELARAGDEKNKLEYRPMLATEAVLNMLGRSISEEGGGVYKQAFEMECVRYLREHTTQRALEQNNLYAHLEANARLAKCDPSVRHAIYDLIAERRDGVLRVWNRATADQVNASPQERAQILEQAIREVAPNGIAGQEKYDASYEPNADASEMEVRVPSAVHKIAAATQGKVFEADDPRIPMLVELMKKERAAGQHKDERVRLAAAYAVYHRVSDPALRDQAVAVIAEVAVDGFRQGARADAVKVLKSMAGEDIVRAEKALREMRPAAEDSNHKPYPEADIKMKEAARLSLLGQVQAQMGKNAEAEASLRGAFNIYRGKPVDAPLTADDGKPLAWSHIQDTFNKYKGDRRFREIADSVQELGRVQEKLNLPGAWLKGFAGNLRYYTLGKNHPDVIASNRARAAEMEVEAARPGQERKFGTLYDANQLYIETHNAMVNGMYPYSVWDKVDMLDRIGNLELEMSDMERGYDDASSRKGKSKDLQDAINAFTMGLETKEKYKFPAPEIAESHWNLARAHEQSARLEPQKQREHLAKAEEELNKALQITRSIQAENPIAHADQLRNASEFYRRRGDTAKADQFNRQAMEIYDKKLGSGSISGKSNAEIARMLAEFKRTLGEGHPLVAKLNVDISRHFINQGNFALAERHADEAIAAYKAKPPENSDDYIRAIYSRHQALWKQGAHRNADSVETLEILAELQERASGGRLNTDLERTYSNLRNCLVASAGKDMESGNYDGIRAKADRIIELDKKANGGTLSDAGRRNLKSIAGYGNMAFNKLARDKPLEAAQPLLIAIEMKVKASDGKPDEATLAEYQPVARSYEGLVANQLEKFKKDGTSADFNGELKAWLDIHKALNGGKLPRELAGKVGYVIESLSDKLNSDVLPDPEPYNEEAYTKAEPALRALITAQQERLAYLREEARAKPDDEDLKFDIDRQALAIAERSNTLKNHYMHKRNFAAAEKLCAESLEAIYKHSPDSIASADVMAQLIDVYGSQGKNAELLSALDKHMQSVLQGASTEQAARNTAAIIQYLSSMEGPTKRPGLAADVAEKCVRALENHVQTLPPGEQRQFLTEHAPSLTRTLYEAHERITDFLETDDGKKLSESEKTQMRQSMEKLAQLADTLQKSTEQPIRDALREWESKLPNPSEDDWENRTPSHFRTLMESYARAGKLPEAIETARDHLNAVLQKGTTEQIAAAFDTAMESISSQRPELSGSAATQLVKILEEHLSALPAEERDAVMAGVGPHLQASLSMMKRNVEFALDDSFKPVAAAARPALQSSVTAINQLQEQLTEKTVGPLKKTVESWGNRPPADAEKSDAFRSLLSMYVSQGKFEDATQLTEQHLTRVMRNGTPAQVANALLQLDDAYGWQHPDKFADLIFKAADLIERQASTLPPAQKNALLSSAGSALMRHLNHINSSWRPNLSTTYDGNGRQGADGQQGADAEQATAEQQAADEKRAANARRAAERLATFGKTAAPAFKERMDAAIQSGDGEAISQTFQDLAMAYVVSDQSAELKSLVATYAKAMGDKGQVSEAVRTLGNTQEIFMTSRSHREAVEIALANGMQELEKHASAITDQAVRRQTLQEILWRYESLGRYAATPAQGTEYQKRADAIRAQMDGSPVPR